MIGIVAAVLTTGSALPQVIKALKTKKTRDISLVTYLMMTTGILIWLTYGILIRDIPLMFANGTGLVLNAIMLFCKLRYG
jgi:MtN3 and saliva related transmembrane protein